MKILVIEDDADFRNQEVRPLREMCHEVVEAGTKAEAEALLDAHGNELAVALVDLYLEDNKLTGLDLIRKMRKEYPQIVPIVVSGHADLGHAALCMEAGAFSFISKDRGDLPQALREKVEKAGVRSREERGIRLFRGQMERLLSSLELWHRLHDEKDCAAVLAEGDASEKAK